MIDLDFDYIFERIPSWTEKNERQCLSKYAQTVPDGGIIVEIGALYGGVTAILALSQPKALVISIDNFSWTPEGYPKASIHEFNKNMKSLDIKNFQVIELKSDEVWRNWNTAIDFLWIDGGHDFNSVFFDLSHYSHFTNLIALHDYDNPSWPDIRQAVERFIQEHPEWKIIEIAGMVVVLQRSK